MASVAVIDYGMGNLHSVASALRNVGQDDVQITSDEETILNADRVIFPGVGAIRDCMAEIRRLHFDRVVHDVIASGKPLLAICVGMQALMQHSEENGGVDCLAELPGQVKFFGDPLHAADGTKLKVPHMGWNQVSQTISHPLWQNIEQNSRFYFVHSYYVHCAKTDWVAATTAYGVDIHAALAHANLFAVQFHPEKSSTAGLQLLKNFLQWDGRD
ncbi:MAG TPA: imidazole glycerol phosphate synthase subunit HisH [Spongiibacteraceae bacterium]|nr:imidazole glycerol phosphate synthase subunit HisH [Spongiibacteraceae bacterium]